MCYARLGHLFPYLPRQPGYHERLKAPRCLTALPASFLATYRPDTQTRRLQVDHGWLAIQVCDNEVCQQACVGAAGADDLDGGLRVLGYLG